MTLQHFRYVFDVGFNSVKDTLVVAAFVTPLSGLLGMMIAFLVVAALPGRQLMEFTSILNFAVPGTVVGIGYIPAFNGPPSSSPARWPFWWQRSCSVTCRWVFRTASRCYQVDPAIEEAAQNLGPTA